MSPDRLFALPQSPSDVTSEAIWQFYRNIYRERAIAGFTPEEEARLFRYDCGFGNMAARTAYYKQAFIWPFHRVVQAVFQRFSTPAVLDVCCGTGMQTLIFAILGAKVTGIDYDAAQLATLRKRQALYAGLHPGLAIETRQADITRDDAKSFGAFDVIHSHVGAGHILSAKDLFARFASALKPGGLLILKNGNPACVWLKAAGVAPLSSTYAEYLREAAANGFMTELARGTTAFPRPLWIADLPLDWIDPLLAGVKPLQVHFEFIFRKAE